MKYTKWKKAFSLGLSIFVLLIGSVGLTGCESGEEVEQEGLEQEEEVEEELEEVEEELEDE